ncbi:MAG: hypothetical protein ACLT76_05265 [Clostridium fessum]
METVGRIVDETYRETGGFDVKTYLREGRQAEEKEVSILQPLMKFWTENVF